MFKTYNDIKIFKYVNYYNIIRKISYNMKVKIN